MVSKNILAHSLRFHQLLVYDEVVRSGSMLAAAKTLNLTQPAISRMIRELEDYFGGELLIRGNRGISITPFGELIREHGRLLLANLNQLTDEINEFASGKVGHVMVGSLVSASMTVIPAAIRTIKQRAPNVTVAVRVGAMESLFVDLIRGDLDIIISRVPEDWGSRNYTHSLSVTPLYDEALALVTGPKHSLSLRQDLQLMDIYAYPWIIPTKEALLRPVVEKLFVDAGLSLPEKLVESSSILTTVSLLADGEDIAFMPRSVAKKMARAGLVCQLDFAQNVSFGRVSCFLPKMRPNRLPVKYFLEYLQSAAQALSS